MTVISAPASIASRRCLSVPTATANRRMRVCSHAAISAGQVSRATSFGAIIRTRRTVKESSRKRTASSVAPVLPEPIRLTISLWGSRRIRPEMNRWSSRRADRGAAHSRGSSIMATSERIRSSRRP